MASKQILKELKDLQKDPPTSYSAVVPKLRLKNALILGTSSYMLYVAANLKPNWYTMIPASSYLGFCASIIWVAEGTYLTLAARSQARAHNLHEGAVIGDFNGEFWAMFALHQAASDNSTTLSHVSPSTRLGTVLCIDAETCSLKNDNTNKSGKSTFG